MVYSGDPAASQSDEIRYLVQDTDQLSPLLTDAELDYEIAKWTQETDDTTFLASHVAEAIGRKYSGVTTVSADGVEVDLAGLAQAYFTMADRLQAEWENGVAANDIDLDNLLAGIAPDLSIAPLSFGLGEMDNPEGGQQQLGGRVGVAYQGWWSPYAS